MAKELPLPPGLEFMIEKRGTEERRDGTRRSRPSATKRTEPEAPASEQRSSDRRRRKRRKSDKH